MPAQREDSTEEKKALTKRRGKEGREINIKFWLARQTDGEKREV